MPPASLAKDQILTAAMRLEVVDRDEVARGGFAGEEGEGEIRFGLPVEMAARWQKMFRDQVP